MRAQAEETGPSARRPLKGPTRLPGDREQALFEAGIKLGGIFHQFVGTPVSPRTRASLARAIEDAVSLQPFVRGVRVRILPSREAPPGKGRFGYRYLTAPMLDVRLEVVVGRERVRASLRYRRDLRYPLMQVDGAGKVPRAPRNPSRPGGARLHRPRGA